MLYLATSKSVSEDSMTPVRTFFESECTTAETEARGVAECRGNKLKADDEEKVDSKMSSNLGN